MAWFLNNVADQDLRVSPCILHGERHGILQKESYIVYVLGMREIGMNLADELSKTLTLPAGRRSYLPAQMLERW